jgi:gas vesicle protein
MAALEGAPASQSGKHKNESRRGLNMAKQRGKELVIGAVIGGILGAVTALLFAPKSGRELRADIADQYHQISDKTQQIASDVSQKTTGIVKNVGNHTSEWIGKAKEAASHALGEVRSRRTSGKIEDVQEAEKALQAEENENIVGIV